MQPSLAEILTKTGEISTRAEKVEYLKSHNSLELRNILILIYDKTKKILLPDTAPPYKPSDAENHGAWQRECRKLKYFVAGFGFDEMNQGKRENVFIELLETVHADDAKIFLKMLTKEPVKGVTVRTINLALGNIIQGAGGDKEE
jgi:hypothetical protein